MDYYYPKAGGDYRFHIQQKCELAIGRGPSAMMDTAEHTVLRFDTPLDEVTEKPLIDAIFADPATAADAPIPMDGSTYMIKDIYDSDFRDVLGAALGCDVILWFPKSDPGLDRPDRIAITFSRALGVQDRKDAENAFQSLILGWV